MSYSTWRELYPAYRVCRECKYVYMMSCELILGMVVNLGSLFKIEGYHISIPSTNLWRYYTSSDTSMGARVYIVLMRIRWPG